MVPFLSLKSNVCVFMCKLFSQTYIITTNVLLWVVVRQGIGMKIITCAMVHTFCNTKQVFWQQFWQWLDTFEIDSILIFLIVEEYGTLSSLSRKVFGMFITFFRKQANTVKCFINITCPVISCEFNVRIHIVRIMFLILLYVLFLWDSFLYKLWLLFI